MGLSHKFCAREPRVSLSLSSFLRASVSLVLFLFLSRDPSALPPPLPPLSLRGVSFSRYLPSFHSECCLLHPFLFALFIRLPPLDRFLEKFE